MGYILNKDQMDIVNLAKDYAVKKVMPLVPELDNAPELTPETEEGKKLLDLYQGAVDLGLTTLEIPEEYGGLGQDYYTVAAAYEELSKVDAGFATAVAASSLGLKPILQHGNDEQKKLYADFLNGEKTSEKAPVPGFCAFCLTEPDAGSDASNSKTTAKKVGDE
ncbi:MAG: acyl-CoA dehydrogenase family protein [Caecibacter massiliensis]|nr:acyl-CoA dehydrogenase family protein [Caecibacter massiliensis]